MTRILVHGLPYEVAGVELRRLQQSCPDVQISTAGPSTKIDDVEGEDIDVLVGENAPRMLDRWKKLRLVQLVSAGANQLVGHPIMATNIPVCTASGTHSVPIAQFATAAWLSAVHRFSDITALQRTRTWPNRLALAGRSVRGMTAGIFGYGSIGRECGRQLHSLGMEIVCSKADITRRADEGYNAWTGTGDPTGSIPARWFAPKDVNQMLPLCDVLIVTAPATPQTISAIGAKELKNLKPSAHVIVVSRGGIVDESALAEALQRRQLAGAFVDCFAKEPLEPGHPFFETPNMVLTPHMSGVYDGFWPAFIGLLAENLARLNSGHPLLNLTTGAGY